MRRRWSKREDRVSHRVAVRARIILELAVPASTAGNVLAAQIRVSPQTVSLWRRRFVVGRLAGLAHRRVRRRDTVADRRPRGGYPHKLS